MLTIGTRIKTVRVLYSLSQEQLAMRIGVSRRQVAYWEAEQDSPSAERIPQICQALNVSADWLLTGRSLSSMTHFHNAVVRRQDQSALRRVADVMTLLNKLPNEEWVNTDTSRESMPALQEDHGAFAVRLPDDSHAPTYCSGDLLYFRPLKIAWTAPIGEIAPLHGRDLALSLNGKNSIQRFSIQRKSKRAHTVQLTSIGKKQTRCVLRSEDSLALHGVAYKCVRPL